MSEPTMTFEEFIAKRIEEAFLEAAAKMGEMLPKAKTVVLPEIIFRAETFMLEHWKAYCERMRE